MKDTKREIKDRPTEALKNRKDEIQLLLLYKQKYANRYREKLMQLGKSCLDLRDEYKTIDRVIFLRENHITKIPASRTKKEKKQEASVRQRVEDMSAAEASELLSQLLAIQKRRQR